MRDKIRFFGMGRNAHNILHILRIPHRTKKVNIEAHVLIYLVNMALTHAKRKLTVGTVIAKSV